MKGPRTFSEETSPEEIDQAFEELQRDEEGYFVAFFDDAFGFFDEGEIEQ
jgi:hypothetical protein